jgi:HK97 family phage major capsid protein
MATPTLIEAKAGMRDLGTKAQTVVNDDTLTPPEKMLRLDNYAKDLKAFQDVVAVHEAAARLMVGGEAAPEAKSTTDPRNKTIGRQIVESEAFRQAAAAKSGSRWAYSAELGTKVAATVDEGTTIANGQLNGAAGVLSLPDYLPGIVDIRFAPLSVAQLFAQGATTSAIVSYVKEATETAGAAATSEKTKKGQADATFTRVNEQVGKVAAFFKITDEMLQDTAQAESFLSNRLVAQVGREEENEALNGTGYPALAGILARSGMQTTLNIAAGTIADPMLFAMKVFNQVTAIRTTAFVEPDAVVMNPLDWQYLQLARDVNKQFYAGGPFSGAYGNGGFTNVAALWGLRVVQSPRIAAGTALVGGFQEGGQFFRRQGITVEMANQNEDDFVNNLITVRAESRSALAIYRAGAFGKVTVTWA